MCSIDPTVGTFLDVSNLLEMSLKLAVIGVAEISSINNIDALRWPNSLEDLYLMRLAIKHMSIN